MHADWDDKVYSFAQTLSGGLGLAYTEDVEPWLEHILLVDGLDNYVCNPDAHIPPGTFASMVVLLLPPGPVCLPNHFFCFNCSLKLATHSENQSRTSSVADVTCHGDAGARSYSQPSWPCRTHCISCIHRLKPELHKLLYRQVTPCVDFKMSGMLTCCNLAAILKTLDLSRWIVNSVAHVKKTCLHCACMQSMSKCIWVSDDDVSLAFTIHRLPAACRCGTYLAVSPGQTPCMTLLFAMRTWAPLCRVPVCAESCSKPELCVHDLPPRSAP